MWTSLPTRKPSLMRIPPLYGKFLKFLRSLFVAWSWSTLIMGTFSKKYVSTRKEESTWRRKRSGSSFCKWWWGWRPFMTAKSCTGIWRYEFCFNLSHFRVLIYFCTRTCRRNLGIWMWARFSREAWATLKQARLTMPHQKFGRTCHMIANRTYGLLDVFSTRCAL